MIAEESLVATAVNAWKIEIERAGKLFAALSDEQLGQEFAPGKNRLVYLYAHLIAVHDRMIPLLGVGDGTRFHPELDAPFLAEADKKNSDVPTAAELTQWWNTVNAKLWASFSTWSAADWTLPHTAVSADDFAANPLRNRLAVLLSRTAHISYHVGQAVLVNKGA